MHWRIFCWVCALGAILLVPTVQADGLSSSEKSGSDRVEFTASRVEGHPGMEVRFTNTSRVKGEVAYLWEFGDGAISTELHPVHVYEQPGTYNVALNAVTPGVSFRKVQSALIQVKEPVFLASFENQSSFLDGWHDWDGPEWDSSAGLVGEAGIRVDIPPMEPTLGLVKMQNPNQTGTTGGGGCTQCMQMPDNGNGNSNLNPLLPPTGLGTQKAGGGYVYAWYFNLSSLTLKEDDSFVMFKLRQGSIDGEEVAGVEIRYAGGRYQIRYRALEKEGLTKTPWKNLDGNATYSVSIQWEAANPSLSKAGSMQVSLAPVSLVSLALVSGTSVVNLDNSLMTSDYVSIGVMDGHVMSERPGSLILDHFAIYQN